MRKFKFIGTETDAIGYGQPFPKMGKVYNENRKFCNCSVLSWAKDEFLGINKEWEEVFEDLEKELEQKE